MRDSQAMIAERRLQQGFSKSAPLAILLPPLAVLLFAWMLAETPDRQPRDPAAINVRFDPVRLAPSQLPVAGAWTVVSADPDFGGVSALAVEPDGLLALSDSGRVLRFPRPAPGEARASIRDLPTGPRTPLFKRDRDSESLLRDPLGRGWWVGFEWRHQLWLYGDRFRSALRAIALPADGWSPNAGIEAIVADRGALMIFPETTGTAIRVGGTGAVEVPVRGLEARVSDAAALPDGRLLLLERKMTWRGFANALVLLERDGAGYRVAARIPLPLGPLDNAEALAAEPMPGGGVRLWLMTDDNFQRPLRTLLVAFELPARFRSPR